MSQLTITLDDSLLHAAQEYAQRHGQQLDALVTQLLAETVRPATLQSENPTRLLSPVVQELYGSVSLPPDFDYKTAIEKAILEKYNRL